MSETKPGYRTGAPRDDDDGTRRLSLAERIEHTPWRPGFPEPETVDEARVALARCNRIAGGTLMELIASAGALRHRPERGHLAPPPRPDAPHRPVSDELVRAQHQKLRSRVRVAVARSRVLRRWIAERTGGTEADPLAVLPATSPDELLAELVDALLAARQDDAPPEVRRQGDAVLRRAVAHVKDYRRLLATHAEVWEAEPPAKGT